MSKVSVFDKEWIDLVFEGRNKSYGAYQLRREDPKTTIIALISGIALIGALVSVPYIVNLFKDEVAVVDGNPGALPEPIEDITPVVMPPKPKPIVNEAAAPAPKPKEDKTKLVTPVATDEPSDDDVPKTKDFDDTNPGNETVKGTGGGVDIGPTSSKGPEDGTGTNTKPDEGETGTGTFVIGALDKAPNYPGGIDKFIAEVGKRYRVPEIERATTLKVYVSFVVEKDGTLSNITVPRDPGNGLGEEAIRVLKSMKTKWSPGLIKGKPVRTSYTLPIVVNVR